MSKTTKYLLLSALFCLALMCFFVGNMIGAAAFIALGLLLELTFWLTLFQSFKKRNHKSDN